MISTHENFLIYDEPVEASGFLWIGDPHVSSVRPGRRKDPDWPDAIFRKLSHAIAVANDRRLVPVFLGDMFEEPVEPEEAVKTRLIRILKQCWMPPVCNVGNHDKAHKLLSDEDSLSTLGASDVVDVCRDGGPVLVVHADGRRYGLGMTPYDAVIPNDVRGAFRHHAIDEVVWATHHDIAFGDTYAGAVQPFPVEGCDLVVNGHVHLFKGRSITVGPTAWFNPGNINRRTVDLAGQEPCVFATTPGNGRERIPLPHAKDVFDLTGRLVAPTTPDDATLGVDSAFVKLLASESSGEMERSQDGSVVREIIEGRYATDATPDEVRFVVDGLWRAAVAEARAA